MNHEVVHTNGERRADATSATREVARPLSTPRYRVASGEDALRLEVELPGVAPADVSLFVEEGVLHLEAKHTLVPTGERILRQALEFRPTDYRGRWRLPENVDADGVTTELRHGVLSITLPLRQPRRRKITIH